MFIVGSKKHFAVECTLLDTSLGSGRIFLYVNGERYGDEVGHENLKEFFMRIAHRLQPPDRDYLDLFLLDARDFYDFYRCISDAVESRRSARFELLLKRWSALELDRGVIFQAEYLLDNIFIAIIPSRNKEKLVIARRDRDEESVAVDEVVLPRGEFCRAFTEMGKNFALFPSTSYL